MELGMPIFQARQTQHEVMSFSPCRSLESCSSQKMMKMETNAQAESWWAQGFHWCDSSRRI